MYRGKIRLLILLFALSGCGESTTKKLHEGVYLHQTEEGSFDLVFDPDEEGEWLFTEVDSLGVGKNYEFLFYGIGKEETDKQWHYVAGSPDVANKEFGGWYDGEFRKYRLSELGSGRQLYGKIRPAGDVWKDL